MADRIRVMPANLRAAADHHDQASEYLRNVPTSHAAIQESLDSLGPIFSELREAGRELLEHRRLCYEQQSADHAELAEQLRASATAWEDNEEAAAAKFKGLDDGR
jgi:uncharacterized protein YukE